MVTYQHVDMTQEEIELCSQKRIERQTKFPANTLHMSSLHFRTVIAKRSVHFFQGLYCAVSVLGSV